MAFIRKVKTKSGAIAVQIAYKVYGRITKLEHIGSSHNPEELTTLISLNREKLQGSQMDLFSRRENRLEIKLRKSVSDFLYQVLNRQYQRLGLSKLKDTDFTNLCIARIVEPTSKLDSLLVLEELGVDGIDKNQLYRCLQRVVAKITAKQLVICVLKKLPAKI